MPSLSIVRAANAKFAPASPPVALFVGGTAGIGKAMAEAFARYTKGNAHILICGRNRQAAEAMIASFPKPPAATAEGGSTVLHEFVACDATLMKNVRETARELLGRLPKLNFLVQSPGYLTLRGRDETEEGLDRKMALNYYARWKFTQELIPLLRRAREAGEDAKVFSVLGAGQGGAIDLDDLGLKKNFSVKNCALATPTYTDLMMEEFAIQQPDMAFTQAFPGLVRTDILKPSSPALRWLAPVIPIVLYPVSVSPEECAEYMLWALFDGEKGAFRRGDHGDDIGKTRYYGSEEARKRLWDHTVEAVKV